MLTRTLNVILLLCAIVFRIIEGMEDNKAHLFLQAHAFIHTVDELATFPKRFPGIYQILLESNAIANLDAYVKTAQVLISTSSKVPIAVKSSASSESLNAAPPSHSPQPSLSSSSSASRSPAPQAVTPVEVSSNPRIPPLAAKPSAASAPAAVDASIRTLVKARFANSPLTSSSPCDVLNAVDDTTWGLLQHGGIKTLFELAALPEAEGEMYNLLAKQIKNLSSLVDSAVSLISCIDR